jgi:hypothetical protein
MLLKPGSDVQLCKLLPGKDKWKKYKGILLDYNYPKQTSDKCWWWELVTCSQAELIKKTEQYNEIIIVVHHITDMSVSSKSSVQTKGQKQ